MSFANNVDVTVEQWLELSKAAEIAFSKAYAPYSDFKVGAAALTADKKIVQGCNVENASYGLTVCAERNCIAHGVIATQSNKKVKFTALVIYTAQEKLTPPCGACRQVISEFFPKNALVMAVNHLNEQQKWTVEQLLPDAFTPDSLLNKT
ncbi:cytidine deaminase [Candidatus Colwellia aromaticivorans]|uniref:cytidine deaminase n=1 Tax=Candidatus Colwellia aromaticivorans TaxID=2267621 RepID=UPI000DF3B696|nr:cytidine deaminase [Candidatus Colwellia aromaticivorans]